jgi:hypothetical protein
MASLKAGHFAWVRGSETLQHVGVAVSLFQVRQADPAPEQQKESDKGQVFVDDLGRSDEANNLQYRTGDKDEQFVHAIVVPTAAGQEGEQALADQKQQGDLDERAQHANNEKFRMTHGMFKPSM